MTADLVVQAEVELVPGTLTAENAVVRAMRAVIKAKLVEHTRRAYNTDLNGWLAFCVETGHNVSWPTLEAASAYRGKLIATIAPKTVNRRLGTLSTLYETVGRQLELNGGRRLPNPFHVAALPRPPARRREATPLVSPEQTQAIFDALEKDGDKRDTALIGLLHGTGLRRASIAGLTFGDLIVTGSELHLRVELKGGREGQTLLDPVTRVRLEAWIAHSRNGAQAVNSTPIFPSNHNPKTCITPDTITKVVAKWCVAAGVTGVSPHSFRASFITEGFDAVKRGEITARELQHAAHHTNSTTTELYDRRIHTRGDGATSAIAAARARKDQK